MKSDRLLGFWVVLFYIVNCVFAWQGKPLKAFVKRLDYNDGRTPLVMFNKNHNIYPFPTLLSRTGHVGCKSNVFMGGVDEDAQDPIMLLLEEGRGIVGNGSTMKIEQSRKQSAADASYGVNNGDIATEEVADLIKKRMAFRFEKNFEAADLVRDELLFTHQVTIHDRLGIWKSEDGRSGSLKGYSERYSDKIVPAAPVPCTLSEEHINQLVSQRTHLRRKRMFTEADKIRNQLASSGVELMDASNEWRSYDGTLSGMQSLDW